MAQVTVNFFSRSNFNRAQLTKKIVQISPRPPLRKSLVWTEAEAAIRLQAYCRGILVRIQPEVQELRKWQRELRLENQNIAHRVEKFWSATPISQKQLDQSHQREQTQTPAANV
jgi:hypothetical protein